MAYKMLWDTLGLGLPGMTVEPNLDSASQPIQGWTQLEGNDQPKPWQVGVQEVGLDKVGKMGQKKIWTQNKPDRSFSRLEIAAKDCHSLTLG